MEKLKVKQDENSRFMIVHHDRESGIERFFGGFYNETECPGTEDESFFWGLEKWVDCPEDGAMMFSNFQNAKDCLDVIDDEHRDGCSIVLYGKGNVENAMLGSYWYPLKMFKKEIWQ